MSVEVRPATSFDDVRAVVGPVRPDANVCWCLSYRIPAKENTSLKGEARGERVRQLMEADVPLGVVAYRDGVPAGWAAVAPRSETTFAQSRVFPHVDESIAPWRTRDCGRTSRRPASPTPATPPRSSTAFPG